MSLTISNVTGNLFYLATFASAIVGWIVFFSATCALTAQKFTYGLVWFEAVFLPVFIGAFFYLKAAGTFEHYKQTIQSFMVYNAVIITSVAQSAADSSAAISANTLSGGAMVSSLQALLAGCILILIPFMAWIVVLGSAPGSFVHSSVEKWGPSSGGAVPSKVPISNPVDVNSSIGLVPAAVPIEMSQQPPVSQAPLQYNHKAKALFDYAANPSDPQELSFKKDDLLDVANPEGNKWWYCKKADGSTGIAPSNYLQLL
ncbi:hypothetical protein BKA69DRAFT_1083192 [Paraphysoderma sedebokerense]|nr:hypothetical protein BKA69DRAFT_1083192 [Paraphysoderma sedebokerense]